MILYVSTYSSRNCPVFPVSIINNPTPRQNHTSQSMRFLPHLKYHITYRSRSYSPIPVRYSSMSDFETPLRTELRRPATSPQALYPTHHRAPRKRSCGFSWPKTDVVLVTAATAGVALVGKETNMGCFFVGVRRVPREHSMLKFRAYDPHVAYDTDCITTWDTRTIEQFVGLGMTQS